MSCVAVLAKPAILTHEKFQASLTLTHKQIYTQKKKMKR